MSDILIKNMEMPKEPDEWTEIIIYGNGKVIKTGESWRDPENGKCYYTITTPLKFFNAVPVLEHGRLIDADELHKLFEDQWHYLQVLDWNENPTAEARQSGISWCINTMHDDAPTIIPENHEEEEMK